MEATNGKGKGKGRAKKAKVMPTKHMLTMLPGEGRKNIGVAMSKKICYLFTDPRMGSLKCVLNFIPVH